jgi:histidine ammonia-lyase
MAMDSMKNCVANLADLADRQIATLVDIKMNHGLPPNLTGAQGERKHINHGFKAIQIGCSAWTAEALKLTMPASVFSRSTECHNQDKVSMGTIAARDCLRILQLTEQVLAATLLASVQGIRLRIINGELAKESLTEDVATMVDDVSSFFELLEEDRPTDTLLRQTISYIQEERWELYETS